MNTSATIKQAQYNPHPVTRIGPGKFQTPSRDSTHQHVITRMGDRFMCDCRCPSLCHHVIDLVMDSAGRRGWQTVQLWTSQDDAVRQKRRKVRYQANVRSFWVTYANWIDPVAALDAEIDELGKELAKARRHWYSVSSGQVKADASAEMARLRALLMEKSWERAETARKQMREAA